jgi:outer membrane protein assembly factor BamB
MVASSDAEKEKQMFNDLVFVGFNSRVAAINRDTGDLAWQWKSPKGTGYVTIMLDGDRLIVSVVGYTYCLIPSTGQVLWSNELPGMGTGVASLASVRGGSISNVHVAASSTADQNAAAG